MTAEADAPTGTLAVALAHANRLLERAPALAAEQAEEILRVIPDQPDAVVLGARAKWALGQTAEAVGALRRFTEAHPEHPAAWRALADLSSLAGETEAADAAHLAAIRAGAHDPVLVEAALALRALKLNVAEQLLRERLKAQPTDVAAIRMLAEVAARLGRYTDAANLLTRCLELSPNFHEARRAYAQVLQRAERPEAALVEAERLLAIDPDDVGYGMLKAAILTRLGEQDAAIALYAAALQRHPYNPKGWMSYGHALKTAGRQADGVAAYRRALEQAPQLGEVWWSLANLKTLRFQPDDLAAMRAQLARDDLGEEDALHLHFALARGLEDAGDFASAFQEYRVGNDIRRDQLRYQPERVTDEVARARALFTPAFFAARAGAGCAAPDPIFIVGLPRSGSTLVEQILASHSMVEGTMELPDLPDIARSLGSAGEDAGYPEALEALSPSDLRALGLAYLERTRIQRKTDRPFFIDKLPNNWLYVPFIQLVLPNATIIDARRHPLGCCLSGYKQHFARGQAFSYDLGHIGRYYRDYVALMARVDAVLPGRVHRVVYERMVADTEAEVRALLAHARLPFEDACLRFWTNDRAVRTASSEQVRQPIFDEALDHWRKFEAWLDPLKAALGPVLDAYPDAPSERAASI